MEDKIVVAVFLTCTIVGFFAIAFCCVVYGVK